MPFYDRYHQWRQQQSAAEQQLHEEARRQYENYTNFFQQNRARAHHSGPTVELIENVSLPPFVAYRKHRVRQDGKMEMMVSPFLFNLFIKYPKLMECVLPHITDFQSLYERKQYQKIFNMLAQAVKMIYF